MSQTQLIATVFITLALVFYTVGVWAERIKRYLLPWHVAMFWLGLVCDAVGTWQMAEIGKGFDWTSWHTITGQLAIWLMFIHATWATIVVVRNNERARAVFHRYSLVVWLFWLIPYVGGAAAGMLSRSVG